MDFPGGSEAYSVGGLGSVPATGRSPGEGNGNPLKYSCLGKSNGWRSLAGYSPRGRKESDTTEWDSTLFHFSVKCQKNVVFDVLTWGLWQSSGNKIMWLQVVTEMLRPSVVLSLYLSL